MPFAVGETLRFHVEGHRADESVAWRVGPGGLGRSVEVWLDGMRLRLPASADVSRSPREATEWVLALPPSLVRVPTGAHRLRYVVTPHWESFQTEASHYRLPGRAESNEVSFEVR